MGGRGGMKALSLLCCRSTCASFSRRSPSQNMCGMVTSRVCRLGAFTRAFSRMSLRRSAESTRSGNGWAAIQNLKRGFASGAGLQTATVVFEGQRKTYWRVLSSFAGGQMVLWAAYAGAVSGSFVADYVYKPGVGGEKKIGGDDTEANAEE